MRPFRFKHFEVEQSQTPMKVGTDGVVLGAWCSVNEGDRYILDIGCGCGLIALMVAQRTTAYVDAVEINEVSAEEAEGNVSRSPWSERIKVYNADIQSFDEGVRYDHIVTNPPFFNDSLPAPEHGRNIARHSVELPFEELIEAVVRLMSEEGRLSIILPPAEMEHFKALAANRLAPTKECHVYGREGGKQTRVLAEFTKHTKVQPVTEILTIENRDQTQQRYSDQYRTLTGDFYLNF